MSTSRTTIDEAARRRPGGASPDRCHPVVLGDGRPWLIPRPTWWVRPVFSGGKVVETRREFGYRRDVNALVEALAGAEDPELVVSAVATIAAELLREVYDLTEAELDCLLCVRPSDPDPLGWVRAVMDVVTFREDTLGG